VTEAEIEGRALRLARTNLEARTYLRLQPCPACGETRCTFRSSVVMIDGDLASHYTGSCPGCHGERVYAFRLPAQILQPPADGVRFGGAEPSQLLDPGEWLAYADDRARRVPADPSRLTDQERESARYALATALAAMEEVIKFIPEGDDSVPIGMFATEAGRAVRDREPGRFRQARLHALRETYAELLACW
jgi:hypothetical protein